MRRARVAAWGLWGLFVLALALAIYVGANPPEGPGIRVIDAVWAASFIGFPTAGALIAPRMPKRPLGWMLLIAPLCLMLGVGLSDLARFFSGAAAAWTLWGGGLLFSVGFPTLLMIALYLPNGALPSPRWRPVARATLCFGGVFVVNAAFAPGPMETSRPANPIGLEAFGGASKVVSAALMPLAVIVILVGVISLVIRFRKAGGIERQQLKWLALGGAGIIVCLTSLAVIDAFITTLTEAEVDILIVLAILSLPASIAVAVLKTRLYEIDVIVNRTLVYLSLTSILAALYLGTVVLLQRVTDPFTQQSDLAVAGSTLVVASLAFPVRARLQGFIDQRFYRRKYDAAATLAAFSSHLRDEVDLDSLSGELLSAVGRTMQPSHASLWFRTPSG